jgi:hypothetical protein
MLGSPLLLSSGKLSPACAWFLLQKVPFEALRIGNFGAHCYHSVIVIFSGEAQKNELAVMKSWQTEGISTAWLHNVARKWCCDTFVPLIHRCCHFLLQVPNGPYVA